MKKILVITLIISLMAALFTGCSQPAPDTAAPAPAPTEGKTVYKVAYIARAQADSFAAWMANAVIEEAAKYDNIKLDVFDGQASDDTENSLIEN
ncbi:MAG: ABC-type sugar transport system periplasmic component-like protein precursor, partial [Clostridiales bacterium]|nr:ABC-type sugar transport system periplasmic component-like protein precursor [Clostridiales bacterium]